MLLVAPAVAMDTPTPPQDINSGLASAATDAANTKVTIALVDID